MSRGPKLQREPVQMSSTKPSYPMNKLFDLWRTRTPGFRVVLVIVVAVLVLLAVSPEARLEAFGQ